MNMTIAGLASVIPALLSFNSIVLFKLSVVSALKILPVGRKIPIAIKKLAKKPKQARTRGETIPFIVQK
jgi:hypothetical protein